MSQLFEKTALARNNRAACAAPACRLLLVAQDRGFCRGADVTIEKLDVQWHWRLDRSRMTQRMAGAVAHEREPACEDATMRERVEQLFAAIDRSGTIAQQQLHRAFAAIGKGSHPFAGTSNSGAMAFRVGSNSRGEASGRVGEPILAPSVCDPFRSACALCQRF